MSAIHVMVEEHRAEQAKWRAIVQRFLEERAPLERIVRRMLAVESSRRRDLFPSGGVS